MIRNKNYELHGSLFIYRMVAKKMKCTERYVRKVVSEGTGTKRGKGNDILRLVKLGNVDPTKFIQECS